MNIRKNIRIVLEVASNQLDEIGKECRKPNLEEFDGKLNVTIKNCLENLRSSLDYLADQIFKENKLQHKKKA